MINNQECVALLTSEFSEEIQPDAFTLVDFSQPQQAIQRFANLCSSDEERSEFAKILPTFLFHLQNSASPDQSLLNFERFVQSVDDRGEFFRSLPQEPRTVEILLRLFVGSQYLSEILLRNPSYLRGLTNRQHLAVFKSRDEIVEAGRRGTNTAQNLFEFGSELRRFQQWELLRIAACDTFGLLDLKTVTLQLSLLADSVVQLCVERLAEQEQVDPNRFSVLAFGKLGGEELNYSSDIDLVFLCDQHAEQFWPFGQKLIKLISESTADGFLYRVDMRLRPWGSAGALVTTGEAYVDYIQRQGQLWEKQALIKARPIAGNLVLGRNILHLISSVIFNTDTRDARENIQKMKSKIERKLQSQGGQVDVKTGRGGIRDIEFITQYLQLVHGAENPELCKTNTSEALIRLSEVNVLTPTQYRSLSSAYSLLRNIEHVLQLMHNQSVQVLPKTERELDILANRLDFPDSATFQKQFQQHTAAVRAIFETIIRPPHQTSEQVVSTRTPVSFDASVDSYFETFGERDVEKHARLLNELKDDQLVKFEVAQGGDLDDGNIDITVVGNDHLGDFSVICGLLYAYGFNIIRGHVFTGHRKYINVLSVSPNPSVIPNTTLWSDFERELRELLEASADATHRSTQHQNVAGRLAKRIVNSLNDADSRRTSLLPVEIDVLTSTTDATRLQIRGEDTPGFLYELTNAITMNGLSIVQMTIQSQGRQVVDTLHVVDRDGKPLATERIQELKAAIALIKQFTHFLPDASNPDHALAHFRELLDNLFREPNWLEQLSPLQDSEVLDAFAKLLGMSDFLWNDFLKLQHKNLFPIISDVQGLQQLKTIEELRGELTNELSEVSYGDQAKCLNEFKDREMLRVDMRHILGLQGKFGTFSQELTDVAEVVVEAAYKIAYEAISNRYGFPMHNSSTNTRMSVFGLGKCGGRELGFASDIELLFVYEADGKTNGQKSIENQSFFQKVIETFQKLIHTKRKGIFEIDLRLRPYGSAGSVAVPIELFQKYFSPQGDAWPYERQALTKLRPIAGDVGFGEEVVQRRDKLLYQGLPFDLTSMRAMREKQNRQLVTAGTFNAKLSPGGLVDCEYLVQGLQVTYGHLDPEIRASNTRRAMKGLERVGVISSQDRLRLRDAYRFLRRVIDALRMVRGDATDLTIPDADSEEFEFLTRRMGYGQKTNDFQADLEQHAQNVMELNILLEESIAFPRADIEPPTRSN